MSFPQLDAYKGQPVDIDGVITRLEEILTEIRSREAPDNHAAHDVYPALVAKRLALPEKRVVELLDLGVEAGILSPREHVLCPQTSAFLGSFETEEQIPETVLCPYHDREVEHEAADLEVERFYHFIGCEPPVGAEHGSGISG